MHHHSNKIEWEIIFKPINIIYNTLGVVCAVFAMKGFMIPNAFMDGGVTGISILLHEIYHINISLLLVVINIPFLYLSYKHFGKTFTFQTIVAIFLLALGLTFIDVPTITNDKILIALFGGFFIGIAMGLIIRGGGVIDGAEVLAVFTTKKISISIGEIIMIFNSLIFLTAAYKFGIETAMYSIITYFTAVKMCDYVSDGVEEYITLHIISKEYDKVKNELANTFKKGISVYKGERGYLPGSFNVKYDCDIIVTIITRLELLRIREAIYQIDDKAFMYVQSVKEAKGGIIKKKNKH